MRLLIWAGLALAIGLIGSNRAVSGDLVAKTSEEVHVIDGDTIVIAGRMIQIYGIDAPELGQACLHDERIWPCGRDAALALRKLLTLTRARLRCVPWGDAKDPATSVCELGSENIALVLLRDGLAVARPGAFPDYALAEKSARTSGIGLWRGRFDLPWEWRAGNGKIPNDPAGGLDCLIKGKIGEGGAKLLFAPTDDEFDDLTIEAAKGERCFISDEDARRAGWRSVHESERR